MFITAKPPTLAVLKKAATDLGLDFTRRRRERPAGRAATSSPRRASACGISYGGSMPSGWVRLLLEQFEFPFELVYPQTLDAGNLKAKFDVLIFPDGGIPEARAAAAAASAAASPTPTTSRPSTADRSAASRSSRPCRS